MKNNKIFIPKKDSDFTESDMWSWYCNIEKELELIDFTQEEVEHINSYYKEAGLFSKKRKKYFRRHYCNSFFEALNFLIFGRNDRSTIVDLGVGMGTQGILMSIFGARVIGLDLDGVALSIASKRKIFYEKIIGKKIDFRIMIVNCFDVNYKDFNGIDGLYSMFAFNMMQPSKSLIDKISLGFSDDFRLAIIDGNNKSILSRILPSRKRDVWSPQEFELALKEKNMTIESHQGKVSFPPILWRIGINILRPIDCVLNLFWIFPVSHQILAKIKK